MTGGDFYEYVPLDDDTLGFTLGDVAGKGAPAGLFGARIQEIFLAQSVRLIEPAATISEVNNTLLKKSLESRFVTMLYGVLTRDGGLSYCNAGHKPPFLITGDGVRRLETGGLIVGLFDDAQSEQEHLQLQPGDMLVVFNDGISEATNRDGEEFGDDRIIECIQRDVSEPRAVVEPVH